jgi:hypothetical protein
VKASLKPKGRGGPFACPLFCALAALCAAYAQNLPAQEILAGSGTLSSGIAIGYNTVVTGPGALADSIGGGFRIDGDRLLRLLVDKNGRQYLGYRLSVAAVPNLGAYRVSIEPLAGIEDLLRRFAPEAVLRAAPAPKCPEPQVIHEGEGIALDLMTTPDGRQKVTDTIRLLHQTGAEVTTLDSPITFKSEANLVSVPVVVRDAQARATGNLTKDDFQLYDSGKPQLVSRFSVEKPGAAPPAANLPGRFIAYLFDDLHFGYPDDPDYGGGVQDMMRARCRLEAYRIAGPQRARRALYHLRPGYGGFHRRPRPAPQGPARYSRHRRRAEGSEDDELLDGRASRERERLLHQRLRAG